MKILHLSDIHLGSSFNHGKINPETGRNTRLEDFLRCLSICIDEAIREGVDLVLFAGDAFPNSTPPPYIQSAFASQFRRLAEAHIPTIFLVGNHNQHSHDGLGGASLTIYNTLGVPNFIVAEKIATYTIRTKSGPVQVVTLPWLTPKLLLTKEETGKATMAEIERLFLQKVQVILEAEIRKLQPQLPTILLAHLMAERASLGAERFLSVGKGFYMPLSLLIRPEFDYVALGHVHKHQNLNPQNNPPVVYSGSIERVDFSEENEEKGFVLVHIQGKNQVHWEFRPLPARPFVTIELDLTTSNSPQQTLLSAIAKKNIRDAVVRVIYRIRPEQMDSIDTKALHLALSAAHCYTIKAESVSLLDRTRLPELGTGNTLTPLEALSLYLENRKDLQDFKEDILAAAKQLLEK
ncbi:MAG: exonuclease SbcCD subunit D [Geminocystis sp.]|nr:exonuclease SbcCD subunit D [Geminocystis sp.]